MVTWSFLPFAGNVILNLSINVKQSGVHPLKLKLTVYCPAFHVIDLLQSAPCYSDRPEFKPSRDQCERPGE